MAHFKTVHTSDITSRVTLAHKPLPMMNPWLELAGWVLRGKADLFLLLRRNELLPFTDTCFNRGSTEWQTYALKWRQHSTTPIKDTAICTRIYFLTSLSSKTEYPQHYKLH